jgi:serine/threonine-protein kinase
MAISTGDRLGRYEILEPLGAGGMGEVYRAHDDRLDRDVAIKVLPEEVAQDDARLARFEREAKLLASLNHQNIATLYGLEQFEVGGEDVGAGFTPAPDVEGAGDEPPPYERSGPVQCLIMELAEGETLAERIKRGAIPVDDALPIALQIAEGLEAAHEQGIIHRDLKPANVMLSPEGKVKILDFGLAKAWHDEVSDADLTHSPTLTAQMTAAGVLLGTAAYMSPEQARGKPVDKRADLWAFGVILFEMLTGSRLFEGETTSDVLAAVLRAEPDWSELPAGTPTPIVRLLHRCLDRDPRERLHDVADARLEIEEAIARPDWASTEQADRPEPSFRDKVRATWPAVVGAVAVGALLAAGAVWKLSEESPATPDLPTRLSLSLPPGVTIHASERPALAISPDCRWLVFEAKEGDTWRLFKRSLEQFDATPMPGTEDAFHPFFSPDGRWVGFFADGKLKEIPLAGGPPQNLADAPVPWGATWGPDGTIVFNRRDGEGLWRVPSTGGASEQLISPQIEQGEWYNIWPEFLPDGKAVLFTTFRGMTADTARIEVLDLESRAKKTVIENGSYARYVSTGHLIFGQQGAIHVAPFDVERREVTGPSVPVPEVIFYESENGVPHLVVSATGSLAFLPGSGTPRYQLVSVDMAGRERPLIDARRGFVHPRFSPDGERLAVTISEPGDTNVWVLDLATGAQTKLTQEGTNTFPSWTPDGERVTYLSVRGGDALSIDWKRADGHGESEPLVSPEETGAGLFPGSWSPDGETLVYAKSLPSQPYSALDIWIAARDGDREPRPFVATGAVELGPAISPDGDWLAYGSSESGRFEVYVQPFPDGGERHQVSTDGGLKPVWSPDGRSIYYGAFDGGQIVEVSVTMTPRFRAGAAQVLLEGEYESGTYYTYPNFDIAPDGKTFVMVKADEEWGRATEIRLVQNWFEELKRLAPTE